MWRTRRRSAIALRRYLESNGYQVREAEDGADRPARVRSFKPDVLLLDLMLPDMSGVDIVRQIQAVTRDADGRRLRGGR